MNIITKLLLALVFYANFDENNFKLPMNTVDDCIEEQDVQIIKYGLCYNSTIMPEMTPNSYLVTPSLSATKVFAQVGMDNGPTGPSPGDVLEFTVVIANAGGAMDATGTKFTDTVDPNTTLVAGSLKTSVVAINDAFSTVGNVSISVPAASGLTVNDVNLDGDALMVTGVNTAGTQGNVTFAADGSFTFNPNPGFEGSTTFTYTVNDGTFNSTGTVTVTVTGMIWFIQTGATAPGDGRLGSPFSSIANFNSIATDDPNDNIFLYTGAYSSSIVLLNGQNLIGQGAVGTLASLTGVTFSVHPPISPAVIPTLGGTNPTIANAVTTLTTAMNNDVLGITINNTGGTAVTGNNLGTLKVRNVTISNTSGIALNLTNGALDAVFTSISASNASHGIRLQTTTGSFEVTGSGTTDGSGGTISTITTRGIEIITASNVILRNMTLTNANTTDAGGDTVCDEDQGTACNAAIYLSGITGTNIFNNVDITTTQEQGINGITVSNLSMTNCTISSAGAAANVNDIEENAFKFIDLTGTCNFTGCTFQNSFRRNGHIRTGSGNIALTINNCNFSNTAYDVTRFDCFEMRTTGSATGTVNISNSTFARAGSKGIQILAQESSTLTVNITNCSIQRDGNPMAGIEVGATGTAAVINYNINNNPVIESSGEVAVLANTFDAGDLNGRTNNNTSITNTNTTASTFSNIAVVHEGNGQAIVEVKNNPSVVSSNIDIPVNIVALNGTNAAARLDITLDNTDITNTTNTVAGLEGIVLRVGTNTVGGKINTLCGNIKNNDLTLPATVPTMPMPTPYPRAFRARYFDTGSFFNLQGGTSVSDHWTSNSNTNTAGIIAQGPTLTFTFTGTCATPAHAFAPNEEELLAALAANEPAPLVEAAPEAVVEAAPAITDEPFIETPSALTMFSGETITVGGVPGFLLPAGQTMTIVFRVTIDNPFPLGDCSVSNQGTVTGTNFSNVLTDDPGIGGAANPTVTNLNIAPTITVCQGNITTGTDPGLCTASESFTSTAVGCGTPTLTYKIGATTITSPYNFPVGTTTVDVTASNGVLPNATCSFTVTVTDTQAPDITCLSGTQMRGTNLGNCTYTVSGSEFNPTVNENCTGFTLTNNFNNTNTLAGAVLPTGTTTVIWTITDGALLSDMCTVTIQVTDDDSPSITCPMNLLVSCPADVPAPYISLTEFTNAGGTVGDNCSINSASFALINSAGNSQMFTRTYEITDINGLKASCGQTVTVSDVTPPVITPGTIAACYLTVAAAEAAAIAATTAVDGCPGTVTKTASTVGTCTAVITVTARDGANNSASTTYNTRIDNTAPTATAGTIAACYTSVAAAEAAALVATSATDNCPGALTETASTVGTCTAVITVTTSDICGNSSTTTYMTSIDNASPTVMTGTIAACYPTVAAAEAAAISATTAMDDCPSNIVKTASTVGTCSAVVTVTATDACGNSASTTYNTRIDGTAPTPAVSTIAACYPTIAAAEAAALAATTATDNCPGALTETVSTTGTCSAVITVTTTDGCGNSAMTTYNTRIDNTPPMVSTGTIASCYPTVAAAEAAALAATSATDNCSGALTETASTVGTCSAVITVTTTDGCGNSATTTYNTRIDNTAPTVTTGTIASCYPTVAAAEAAALAATSATDNCPGALTETASTVGTCSAVITVTTTDGCGNSTTTTYNTRIDNTAPVATAGTIAACYPTIAAAEAAALAATTATDNCPGTLTETASIVGTCTAVITVTTSDICGNSTTTTYNTSIDNAGPTVTKGTIAACYPTVAAAEAAAIAATTAMDDCPSNIVKTAATVGTCSAVVTVTATDACGNSATTTYNTRIDNTPPTPTAGSIAACYSTVALAEAAALAATSATDNCPGALTEMASTVGTCSAVITVTTTDGCGNSATTTYSTRIDNTPPTPVAGTIAACYPTVAAAEAAALAATSATDNCPGALTETAATVGTCSAVITVTTTDGCGNSATTIYNTRIDNTAPMVTTGTIAACYQTVAAAEAAALTATSATDNCLGALTETAATVGTCSAVVTVTTTDGCGNATAVTYNTRIDNTPPTVTTGTLAACYPTVAAAQAAALAATSATDNCPGALTETAATVGTCTAVVTVTTTDGCGNATVVTYNTRIDNVGPTVTPGTIAACYPTKAAAEAAALVATTIVDDCLSTLTTVVSTTGTCSAVITITSTDGCGNSASTSYNTRIDNTAPVVVCKNRTVTLTGDGTYTLLSSDVLNLGLTSDNCGSITVTMNPAIVSCANKNQTIPVMVTVMDACGNISTCTALITVLEGTALPTGWSNSNVGTTSGSSIFSPCVGANGSFVLTSTGFGTSQSDKLQFAYKEICGNTVVTARVSNITGMGWGGVIIRETTAPGSKKVVLKTQLASTIRREFRSVTNGITDALSLVRPTHSWLRIERIGNVFNGYTSVNGINWNFAFSATISMTNCVFVGIISESINNLTPNVATFDNVNITGLMNISMLIDLDNNDKLTTELKELIVYPNPASDVINIGLHEYFDKAVSIEILSPEGKLVNTIEIQKVDRLIKTIDLSDNPVGLYILKLKSPGSIEVSKRIIVIH